MLQEFKLQSKCFHVIRMILSKEIISCIIRKNIHTQGCRKCKIHGWVITAQTNTCSRDNYQETTHLDSHSPVLLPWLILLVSMNHHALVTQASVHENRNWVWVSAEESNSGNSYERAEPTDAFCNILTEKEQWKEKAVQLLRISNGESTK